MNVSRIRRTKNRFPKFSPPLWEELYHDGIKLEIGCGDSRYDENVNRRKDGYIGLDILDYGQEIVWDVENGGIPLPDESCSHIYCAHTLEHIGDLIGLMNECHRVLKPDGEFYIVVPHRENEKAYVPSHVRWFDKWTFDFFQYPSYADGYQSEVWEVVELIVNERKDIHVRMKPVKK